jgi:hypothetical protein
MNSGSGRLARVCDIARLYPRFDGSWIAFYITLISSYCILLFISRAPEDDALYEHVATLNT